MAGKGRVPLRVYTPLVGRLPRDGMLDSTSGEKIWMTHLPTMQRAPVHTQAGRDLLIGKPRFAELADLLDVFWHEFTRLASTAFHWVIPLRA